MFALLSREFFGFVPSGQSVESINQATSKLVELFTSITTAFGMVIGVSFDVNYSNVKKKGN